MKLAGIRLLFVPRDLWVGVFIDRPMRGRYVDTYQVFVCLLPMLPIRVIWHRIKDAR